MAWGNDKRGIGILPMFSAPLVESATRKYYREGAKDAKLREEETKS
jgi:hypothetical protein